MRCDAVPHASEVGDGLSHGHSHSHCQSQSQGQGQGQGQSQGQGQRHGISDSDSDKGSNSDEEGTASRRVRLRTVLTPDLHLATPGCDAAPLLDLLRRIRHQTLFLVGDIVDTWQFKRQ